MFSPAVLLVFVLSPAATEPTTLSFRSAAMEVLGPRSDVRVETLAEPLPDDVALERGRSAEGVVELIWSPTRETVLLHCYITSQERWVDRTIHFHSNDLDVERGRLLGFAVASMFSDAPSFARTAPAAPEPGPSGTPPATPNQPGAGAPPSTLSERGPVQSWGVPEAAAQAMHRSLEFSAVAVPDFAGSLGPELGAAVALRLALAEPLWLRWELSGRLGEVPAAQANLRRVLTGVGLAWDTRMALAALRVGLRTDVLGSWMQVAHLSSDDVERVHQQRWLLGGDAVLTAGYGISSSGAFYAGLGIEAMFGRTYVYTHGAEVAVVPILRSRFELGFRSDF